MKTFKKKLSRLLKRVKIFLHYFKRLSFQKKTKKKRIIVCCDGLFPHGGFVDRLKGIVSFYEIAKLMNYDFFIQFDNPFELNLFLEPNKINWYIKKEEVRWELFNTDFLYLVNDNDVNPLQLIKDSKTSTFIIYANIDYFQSLYPQLSETELEEKWRASFNQLFRKSELLENKLKEVLDEKYISIHSRFTSLMGDFDDTTKKVLSEAKKMKLLVEIRKVVCNIIDNSAYKCYAFSDSVNFLEFISKNENIHVIDGEPAHMDNFSEKIKIDNHLKTILDFFVIANSEAVFFIRIDPMYHSSFSKYASIVGNKEFTSILN